METKSSTVITLAAISHQSVDASLLREFSAMLTASFPYHEILVLLNPANDNCLDLDHILAGIPNFRCLVMAQELSADVLRRMALEQAIGDYVIVFTQNADESGMVETLLKRLADGQLAALDYIGLRYKPRLLSFEYFFEHAFSKILYLATGFRLEASLSHCACYSRSLINAIIAQNNFGIPLKVLGPVLECRRSIIDFDSVQKKSFRHLFGRIMTGLEIIGTASPRLLRLASLLCFFCTLGNMAYAIYVVLVWLLKETVQAGWISTNIVSSLMYSVLFFTLGFFAIVGADSIARQQGRGKDQVVCEISKTDFIKEFNRINVELK